MSFLENINWRYATKKFDSTKKISPENLEKIHEAIRLAPSSYGTQAYRVITISNPELRAELAPHAWNQPQITSASELIVFIARRDLDVITDEFFTELSHGDEARREALSGYENMVKQGTSHLSGDAAIRYSSEQAHIALGFGLAAAAELKIDSCALGGFIPSEFQNVLDLNDNEVPCVLLALGYRDETEAPRDKFRLSSEALFTKM